jgi:hypothetical protein
MRVVSEREFAERIKDLLADPLCHCVGSVTGPGRSGAIAAVYASHLLRVPFIPFGSIAPKHLGQLLIIDTAKESGRTLDKAVRKYGQIAIPIACYHEPPRVMFWYEAPKPQQYRHEQKG